MSSEETDLSVVENIDHNSSSTFSTNNNYNDSYTFVRNLLGEKVLCTLSDGSTATGRLVCVDRLMNVILTDCVCQRQIVSSDYYTNDNNTNNNIINNTVNNNQQKQPVVSRTVLRHLQQAMVPGSQLISMKIEKRIYDRVSLLS